MVDHFRLIQNILSNSNGCKLINHGHRFVNSRKYLCFCLFMQQRILFCSTEKSIFPKQLQNAPKKDINLRLFLFFVWNCLKSIFGQIPEIYKNTKRYNCRYSGDGTSCVGTGISTEWFYLSFYQSSRSAITA